MFLSEVGADQAIAALALVLLAVAHSLLGERLVLQPLFGGSDPPTAVGLPPRLRNRILQAAWHLTSVTWVVLAVIALGANPLTTVGVFCLGTAVFIFGAMRSHLAWPIFLIGGVAALAAAEVMGPLAAQVMGWAAMVGLGAAAILHLYWSAGGRWLAGRAIPSAAGAPVFEPAWWMTLAVAVALAILSTLLGLGYLGRGIVWVEPTLVQALALVGLAVLAARAVGDGRYMGFTKKHRTTRFARADDQYFTPFVALVVIGASTGLFLGS